MDSRYQIGRRIGVGGMAEVFVARLLGPGGFEKEVALKRIRPELAADPDNAQLFLREARVAARLNHPNVVQVLDAGDDDGSLYLVMEFVDGGDLEHLGARLRSTSRYPTPAAIAWVGAQVCEALAFMFELLDEQGARLIVAHRDISSTNVLVSRTGMVKLGDFGVVRLRQSKTAVTTVRGKWEYFPPEIIHLPADERGDVYALGVTLYKLAAGFHPFYAATGPLCFERARTEAPAPISRLPRALWEIIERALVKDPAARFQKAQQLGDALEDFLSTCGERMSPRLLAGQLFADAAPIIEEPNDPSLSVELDFEGDTIAHLRTQAVENEELRRFEEIFGPRTALDQPAVVSRDPARMVTAPNLPAAPRVEVPLVEVRPDPKDNTDYDDLYARFLAMRPAASRASAPLPKERFCETLRQHRAKLLAQHPGLEIVFDVVFQDGKPLVRPRAASRPARSEG